MITGQWTPVANLSLYQLMPDTRGYMTYEGSMTEPGKRNFTETFVISKMNNCFNGLIPFALKFPLLEFEIGEWDITFTE